LARITKLAPRHAIILKLGLVSKHNIFAARTAACSPSIVTLTRRLQGVPVGCHGSHCSKDLSTANPSHRSRIMLITLALVPRRVLDLLQFLSDAQVWMNDCRGYDESGLWRRQVCFPMVALWYWRKSLRFFVSSLRQPLTTVSILLHLSGSFELSIPLNSRPLTSRRSFILNLPSDTH
jgi:hypothetical protein